MLFKGGKSSGQLQAFILKCHLAEEQTSVTPNFSFLLFPLACPRAAGRFFSLQSFTLSSLISHFCLGVRLQHFMQMFPVQQFRE